MAVLMKLRRWRALRGVPLLTPSTREGTLARATGIVRALEDTVVAPSSNQHAVILWMHISGPAEPTLKQVTIPPPPRLPTIVERWHLRPFVLDLGESSVIIDGPVRLLVPKRAVGTTSEIAITVGSYISVVGSVLRDGVELAGKEISFRDSMISRRLVGSIKRPIIIAEPE